MLLVECFRKSEGGPEGRAHWEGLCVWIPEPEGSSSRCWVYALEGAKGNATFVSHSEAPGWWEEGT